jgi:hypothetical protein
LPAYGGLGFPSKIAVSSNTREKSAIVFTLIIDRAGSLLCRIFGRLRRVRIVRKRGAMANQAKYPLASGCPLQSPQRYEIASCEASFETQPKPHVRRPLSALFMGKLERDATD